jgi:hypothetical protein
MDAHPASEESRSEQQSQPDGDRQDLFRHLRLELSNSELARHHIDTGIVAAQ